jgi:two-component sensor histidine kinase
MKKKATYLLIFVFSITSYLLCGQSIIPEGLHPILQSADDSAKVDQLIEQARMYTPGILQLGDELSDSAMTAARRIGYWEGVIQAQRTKAQVATFRGELTAAVDWYNKALELCGQQPQYKRNKISMTLSKGIVYFLEGDMDQAIDFYLEAESLCDDPQYDDMLEKTYQNMTMAYRKLERYEEAIQVYEKTIPLKTAAGDEAGLAATYNNMGIAYAFLEDFESSLNFLNKAEELFEQLGNEKEIRIVQLSKASALYELGKKRQAKELLATVFGAEDLSLPFYDLMQGKLLFARLWIEEEQYEEAEKHLQDLSPRIERTSFTQAIGDYLWLQATASRALNKVDEAYQYLKEYGFLRDTIVQTERRKLQETMEAKYLTREKEDKILLQTMALERDQKERLIYYVMLLAMLSALGMGFTLYHQRQKANKLLSNKNKLIEKSLNEKEILLKEIHHRVKNNLQIISSLLNLQSRQIEDPKALEAIQEGRNRVASMALIHKNLYQEEDLTGVDAADYIDKLTYNLMSSYQLSDQDVHFEKDIDSIQLDVDVVIPLGLILNEIITNSLKYAFKGMEKGLIRMSLKETEAGLELRVSDNGKGLPAGFDPDQLNSLGFRLIRAFAQKLEADLSITSEAGTQVHILIPKHKLIQYADDQSTYSGG